MSRLFTLLPIIILCYIFHSSESRASTCVHYRKEPEFLDDCITASNISFVGSGSTTIQCRGEADFTFIDSFDITINMELYSRNVVHM